MITTAEYAYCCPRCKIQSLSWKIGLLKLRPDGNTVSGLTVCRECGLQYPIYIDVWKLEGNHIMIYPYFDYPNIRMEFFN